MNVEVSKEDIKEIEKKIIPTFINKYKSEIVSPVALIVSLQAILEKVDEIKKAMDENE